MLGIEVEPDLLDTWRRWLLPDLQPYAVPADLARRAGWPDQRELLSAELRDAFELYGTWEDHALIWLSRRAARLLPTAVRRAQPSAHRWPSADIERDRARVVRYVEHGRRPSRHGNRAPLARPRWSACPRSRHDWRRLAHSQAIPRLDVTGEGAEGAGRQVQRASPRLASQPASDPLTATAAA